MADNRQDPPTPEQTPKQRAKQYAGMYTVAVVALALAVMLGALWWSGGTCTADMLACHTSMRSILLIAPTAILGLGGVAAFVETYRIWRAGGPWWIWQGAGWALFILMTIYAMFSAGAIART